MFGKDQQMSECFSFLPHLLLLLLLVFSTRANRVRGKPNNPLNWARKINEIPSGWWSQVPTNFVCPRENCIALPFAPNERRSMMRIRRRVLFRRFKFDGQPNNSTLGVQINHVRGGAASNCQRYVSQMSSKFRPEIH